MVRFLTRCPIALLLAGIACAQGPTIQVAAAGGARHRTIQSALDVARPGATIRIAPGTYEERLTIRQPVTLVGAGVEATRILSSGDEPVPSPTVTVDASGPVRLEGLRFTMTGQGASGGFRDGAVLAIDGGDVSIRACVVAGSPANGITIRERAQVEVVGSLICGTWSRGIHIDLADEGDNTVSIVECELRNNRYCGISLPRGGARTRIERCLISGSSWHGIRYDGSPTITGNTIFDNERTGIYASASSAGTIEGNVFLSSGVSCWFQARDRIVRNTFVGDVDAAGAIGQVAGVAVLGGSSPTIEGNVFVGLATGIHAGNIGSDNVDHVTFEGPVVARDNVFWRNQRDFGGKAVAQFGEDTGNVIADPGFVDPDLPTLGWASDALARTQPAGAPQPLPRASSWPIQPEEEDLIDLRRK